MAPPASSATRRKAEPKPEKGWRDLTYVGSKGLEGAIVTFGAPGASDPRKINLVDYDTRTRAVRCGCTSCAKRPGAPPRCWLARWVEAAHWAHEYKTAPSARLLAEDRLYAAASANRGLEDDQARRWDILGEVIAERRLRATAA